MAREKLLTVWQTAPFYRDPSGIAPALRLADRVPMTYEEWRDRQEADRTRDRLLEEAQRKRDTAVATLCAEAQAQIAKGVKGVEELTDAISHLTGALTSLRAPVSDVDYLEKVERQLRPAQSTGDRHFHKLIVQILSHEQARATLADDAARSRRQAASKPFDSGELGEYAYRAVFVVAFLIVAIVAYRIFLALPGDEGNYLGSLIWACFFGAVGVLPLGVVMLFVVFWPIGSLFDLAWKNAHEAKAAHTEEEAEAHRREARSAADELLSALDNGARTTIQQIEGERDAAISAIEAAFQHRRAEIASEFARTLEDITVRFAHT